MGRMRADQLLVQRGLFPSRAKAREAIEAGRVVAAGAPVKKPGALLDEAVVIDAAPAHPWVSRGGVKLAFALDLFGVDPADRICVDVGASTGGFTHVLLTRGARRVYAVDVGAGQLVKALADDPRVVNLEGLDARALDRVLIRDEPCLIVADVSFIGLAKALPAAFGLAAQDADLVALVKPQFEIGPGRTGKSGLLAEEEARAAAERAVRDLDGAQGFRLAGFAVSPILGGQGALEFIAHFRRAADL